MIYFNAFRKGGCTPLSLRTSVAPAAVAADVRRKR